MIAAAALLAALDAAAETASPLIAHDPLLSKIMSRQLTQPAGGLTGSVRIGSGQAIPLVLADPLAPLKPAEGLVEKTARARARRGARAADDQLKKLSEDKRRADWSGRKAPR